MGITPDFIKAWIGSTAIGFIIGSPIAAIAVPMIQKLLHKYLKVE